MSTFVPELKGVVDGFTGLAFGPVCDLFGLELEPDATKNGQALLLTNGTAVLFGVVAQLDLDPAEPLDFK